MTVFKGNFLSENSMLLKQNVSNPGLVESQSWNLNKVFTVMDEKFKIYNTDSRRVVIWLFFLSCNKLFDTKLSLEGCAS